MGEPVSASAGVRVSDAGATPPRADGVIRAGKLAGLTMWQAIFVLSWPVLVESLLNSLVGATDTVIAAGLSESATDAVAGAAYFLWFVGLVSIALGVGATAIVARAVGKKRLAVASAVVGQCTTLSLLSGVVVGAFVALVAPVVADLLSLRDPAHDEAVLFMRLYALSVPAQTLLAAYIACCRGAGDSLRPLLVMIVVNVVNLIASFLLSGVDFGTGHLEADGVVHRQIILHNPSPLHLGVAGIALGTVIAWTVGALIMLALVIRGVHGVRLKASRLRIHWHTTRRLVRIGLPNMSETFAMWLGNFVLIMLVGLMHNDGYLGAHMITVRIEAFSFLPGFAMSLAAATLVGQYLGAGSPRLARVAALRCLWIATAMMSAAGLLFVLIPHEIAGVFSQQTSHLDLVPRLLVVAGCMQTIFAVSIVFRSVLRGAGDTMAPMWITWVSIWLIRIPLAWLLCGVDLPLPGGGTLHNPAPLASWNIHPLVGFWIGLGLELVVRGALFTAVFLRGKWLEKKV